MPKAVFLFSMIPCRRLKLRDYTGLAPTFTTNRVFRTKLYYLLGRKKKAGEPTRNVLLPGGTLSEAGLKMGSRRRGRPWLWWLLLACSVALSTPLYSQDFSEDAVKAELVVQFVDHIHWPDENASSFQIAFFGSDRSFFETIQKTIANREVRGKTLTLSRADLSELTAYDVVVVAANQSASLAAVFDVLRGSHTLIVSDSSDDRTHAMINLRQRSDQTMSFEVNRANLVVRNLEVSADILLLGGSEMDVAELYRDIEESLSTMRGEMEAVQLLSASALKKLTTSQEQLRQSERKLATQGPQLNEQLQTIADQSTLIENQLSAIRSGQAELDEVNESFRENRSLLEDQLAILASRTSDQHALVATNEVLLARQADQIEEQRANIQIQSGTIRVQELVLYSALFVLLIISALAVVIYRISQDRKKISQQLAQRGLELEQQVNARTAELTDSEGRYRALSELSPTAVYGTDNRGRCVYVNERWCEFSGLTKEESLGRTWFDVLHPDDRVKFENEEENSTDNRGIHSSEFRFITPLGEITWVYGQRIAQEDEKGNVIGFIATAADITEHKQLEEQLRHAQKMDALGQLTGGVAHDFNNLLAVIEGNLSLLEQALDSSPQLPKTKLLKYITPALHAGRRGAELTQHLLSFARKRPLAPETLDIDEIVRSMEDLMSRSLGEDIDLNVYTKEGNWLAEVDPGGFETALLNLVVNARDAMPTGGKLTLSTAERHVDDRSNLPLGPGRYVVLTVTDSGIGMDAQTLEKVFDPFFTTKEPGRGTGLGLSMVYGFAQQSGGHVSVRSQPDEGTSFEIYLPRSSAPIEINDKDEKEIPTIPSGEQAILVVEDDENVRNITVLMLERLGYHVLCAHDGEAALPALSDDEPFDLLLTDVILPGPMNGPDVADAATESVDGIKVLFMSGYTKEALSNRYQLGETVELIHKPFSYQVLANKVREVLLTA